jgi:ribosome-associated protein YbcJ (S4-like RNA binding protein)
VEGNVKGMNEGMTGLMSMDGGGGWKMRLMTEDWRWRRKMENRRCRKIRNSKSDTRGNRVSLEISN